MIKYDQRGEDTVVSCVWNKEQQRKQTTRAAADTDALLGCFSPSACFGGPGLDFLLSSFGASSFSADAAVLAAALLAADGGGGDACRCHPLQRRRPVGVGVFVFVVVDHVLVRCC